VFDHSAFEVLPTLIALVFVGEHARARLVVAARLQWTLEVLLDVFPVDELLRLEPLEKLPEDERRAAPTANCPVVHLLVLWNLVEVLVVEQSMQEVSLFVVVRRES
jgi:hypothetical protein